MKWRMKERYNIFILRLCFLLIWLHLIATTKINEDDLCYLTNGGSSETIIVNENLNIDSTVGTLSIAGDPSENGTIELSLVPSDGPITIHPNTKNLILRQKLDKEGIDGAESVNFDIVCSKRGSDELSIMIPVRIIVTDANDNSPQFLGAPYKVNVSEVTIIGTVIYQGIKAIDRDQTGPYSTVEYYIDRKSNHKDLIVFDNPLDGSLVLNGSLDYETLPKFSILIRAQDQGEPPQSTLTTVTINVLDADDQNPKFLSDHYTASLPDKPKPGKVLKTSPSPLKAEDPDVGIKSPIIYSFNSNSTEYSYFDIEEGTGQLLVRQYIPDDLYLPVTLVVKATQSDNPDRYALATLVITSQRAGHQELSFLQTDYSTSVLESVLPGQVILTVQTTKPPDKHTIFRLLDDLMEEFAIHPTGEVIVIKPLDYERQQHYKLRILVTDGSKSDIAHVNISIVDVNDHDPQFSQNQYNFIVKGPVRSGALVGKIEVNDQDVNDSIDLSLKGPFARIMTYMSKINDLRGSLIIDNDTIFTISDIGELRVKNLNALNVSTCHVIIVATDDGVPPRQSSVPATISFPDALVQEIVHRQKKDDSSFILMIVFGVILGSLLIIIVTLTTYILKHKKYRDRLPGVMTSTARPPVTKMASYISGPPLVAKNQENTINRPGGMENPIFNMADGNNRPVPADGAVEVPKADSVSLDGIQNHHSIQPRMNKYQDLIKPNGSIPRRVKKLSWEDEQPNRTELDPDVSVTPLGKSTHPRIHPDLMIYF